MNPATYPPSLGGQPSTDGIHGLTTHKVYSYYGHPSYWWALTPPFHPYSDESERSFSVTLLYPHGYLPVRKYGALCCPDFPPSHIGTAIERSAIGAKIVFLRFYDGNYQGIGNRNI